MKIATMKTLKRAVILLITASLIFGCCACAKDTSGKGTSAQSDTGESDGDILALLANFGDYVNYNAASGNGAGKSYTTDESLTGSSTTSTFNSSDEMKWQVLNFDPNTGMIVLMATPTAEKLELYGKTGYKNAETVLNDIGAIYGYGDGATGGRSLTIEDLNHLMHYTPQDSTNSQTFTNGTFINEDGTEVTATEDNPVTISFTASTEEKSTNKIYSYECGISDSFWLASRAIDWDYTCYYIVRGSDSGLISGWDLFASYGPENQIGLPVVPVVTLKANIKTSGRDENDAWNLVFE